MTKKKMKNVADLTEMTFIRLDLDMR